jgi:sugar/nucleoside kinase (ribokinase family)
MNFWIQGEPARLATMLARANVLIINDEEARELSGIQNIRRAAADIRKRGPHTLVIKRGEHGALLFDDAGIFAVPGYPLEEVIDPTGAGDSFAGGFLGYLAAHLGPGARDVASDAKHFRNAMLYGTATASVCVEGVGTSKIQSIVKGDVDARVAQIRALFELPR